MDCAKGYGEESALNGRACYVAIETWIDVAMGLEEESTQAGVARGRPSRGVEAQV